SSFRATLSFRSVSSASALASRLTRSPTSSALPWAFSRLCSISESLGFAGGGGTAVAVPDITKHTADANAHAASGTRAVAVDRGTPARLCRTVLLLSGVSDSNSSSSVNLPLQPLSHQMSHPKHRKHRSHLPHPWDSSARA